MPDRIVFTLEQDNGGAISMQVDAALPLVEIVDYFEQFLEEIGYDIEDIAAMDSYTDDINELTDGLTEGDVLNEN